MIWIGTSGYNYPEWKGSFYPAGLSSAKMLPYYAARFPTVEINYTFYRMPNEKLVAGWAAQTPSPYKLTLKAPRRISHDSRLKDCGDLVNGFCQVAGALGAKLGALLFQLPPSAKKDLPVFDAFLDGLPPKVCAAFEFRHASWLSDPVLACLRDRGAALVAAETDEDAAALHETARFGYLRLRRTDYRAGDLANWLARVRALSWDEAYVFFKHERSGPALAAEFAALAQRGRAIPVRRDDRAREAG
jgi:uncharacterized protein YecE (DUF72 family)